MRLLARALLAVISVDWQTAIAHLEGRHSALSGRWPLLAPPHYAKGLRHPADHVSGSAGIFSRWRGSCASKGTMVSTILKDIWLKSYVARSNIDCRSDAQRPF